MNNKVICAYERLQLLQSTGYGILSRNDLQLVASRHGLTEDEQAQLEALLSEKGVKVYTEEEKSTLLSAAQAFHGIRPDPIPVPLTADERLGKLLALQPPADPDRLAFYDQVIANWESRIAASPMRMQVYSLKRAGATLEEIALQLGQTQESILRTENNLCALWHMAMRTTARNRFHSCRRLQTKDFYNKPTTE